MKFTMCTLNADLAESKKMLAENQPLVSADAHFYKLKSINKRPSSLAVDKFYDMAQAVIPKASPEEICVGGGLIVGGLLESLDINNNKIISRIPNLIPIPSHLHYVVNKSHEYTFMSIVGFFCNYTYIISCDKGERDGLGSLVKGIDLWDVKLVQSIWIDVDAFKGISEEVAKGFDVSLK